MQKSLDASRADDGRPRDNDGAERPTVANGGVDGGVNGGVNGGANGGVNGGANGGSGTGGSGMGVGSGDTMLTKQLSGAR